MKGQYTFSWIILVHRFDRICLGSIFVHAYICIIPIPRKTTKKLEKNLCLLFFRCGFGCQRKIKIIKKSNASSNHNLCYLKTTWQHGDVARICSVCLIYLDAVGTSVWCALKINMFNVEHVSLSTCSHIFSSFLLFSHLFPTFYHFFQRFIIFHHFCTYHLCIQNPIKTNRSKSGYQDRFPDTCVMYMYLLYAVPYLREIHSIQLRIYSWIQNPSDMKWSIMIDHAHSLKARRRMPVHRCMSFLREHSFFVPEAQ